ncbi:MAG: VWA domain-containing protein [Proteobacteria bacterium]|nr:VWA domain-containing protein [Pseudomonadota bacterium]
MRALLLCPAVLLAGCPDRTISTLPPTQGKVEIVDVPANPRHDLDLLFVIDNSGSMREEQTSLRANFRRFIGVLATIDGGLPNVHIGVVTSDLGTQTTDGHDGGSAFGCTARGEDGALRALPSGARFLVDEADGSGGRRTNYPGTLEDAFAQIAEVGNVGCGIEQHLGAMQRALEPDNAVNAGFLRPHAFLAVVVIADEDDCSQAHPGLFAGSTNGDEVNFRCTSDGVACDTPATDFLAADGVRQDCHPKANRRYVESIDRYVAFLKGVKADPADVIVAGILGPTDHFEITHKASTTVLARSCSYPGPVEDQLAYPAVRLAAFLDQFAAHATNQTICDDDLSSALTSVSNTIASALSSRCFTSDLLDVDPVTAGPQYSCAVVETRRRADGTDEEIAVLPSCAHDSSGPCWSIVEDLAHCAFTPADPHLALAIDWHGESRGDDTRIRANCITEDGDGPLLLNTPPRRGGLRPPGLARRQ